MIRKASCCRFTSEGIFVNGEKRFTLNHFEEELTDVYRQLSVEYPKFYKMDLMSKVSFLGVELLKGVDSELALHREDEEVGLLFANSESSSQTDLRFEESYTRDGLPSPSLFVYTLPNIAMGEIAIRNKWYGAHMFSVFPNFAAAYFADYGRLMLKDGAKRVVGGWVDVREQPDTAFFVLDSSLLENREEALQVLNQVYSNH